MKIAITAQGNTLDSKVDPRFGRAKGFILYDTDNDSFEYMDNQQNLNLPQGAGIQSAKNVINSGAQVLLTGHVGPKAFTTLSASDIEIYSGAENTVASAVEDFKNGKLTRAGDADVEGHW